MIPCVKLKIIKYKDIKKIFKQVPCYKLRLTLIVNVKNLRWGRKYEVNVFISFFSKNPVYALHNAYNLQI